MNIIKHYFLVCLLGLTSTYTYSMQLLPAALAEHPFFQETMALSHEIEDTLGPIRLINLTNISPQQILQITGNCTLFSQRITLLLQRMHDMPVPNNDEFIRTHNFLHLTLQMQRLSISNLILRLSLIHPNP